MQPIDDGNYIFSEDEKNDFLVEEPDARSLFRPFLGAREIINQKSRYILYFKNVEPKRIKKLPLVLERIKAVKEFRSKSKREDTRKLANTPTEVAFGEAPDTPFLVMPNHSASRRLYIPILYFEPPTIVSNACSVIPNATVELFGLLTSRMHMVWNSILCGRIRRDFRYSAGMVYNTFPSPKCPFTKSGLI